MSALALHVERDGEGPPVVLLHGFTGSTRTWDDLRDALRAAHTVIALDLPGHGRSPAPEDPARYALRRVADDIARALDAQDIARAAVLGYSMGGRTALRFALAHPDRCVALVLESTSPGIPGARQRQSRRKADRELAAMIERDGVEAFVDWWERLAMWQSQAHLPRERRERLRAQRLAQSPTGLANSLRGAGTAVEVSVLDQLHELRMPALLVCGALDAPFVAHARAMAGRMPDARVAVVPHAGHAVHLEQPAEYADLVSGFLAEHSFPAVNQENA